MSRQPPENSYIAEIGQPFSESGQTDESTPSNPNLSWWKILLLFGFNILFYQVIGQLILLYFGPHLQIAGIIVITGGLSVFTNFGLFWVFGPRTDHVSWAEIGLENKAGLTVENIILGAGVTVVLFAVRFIISLALATWFPSQTGPTALDLIFTGNFVWLSLVISVLVIPMAEEFFYRGLVYNALRGQFSSSVAIIASALCFGIAHLNFIQGILAFIMGVALAWFYKRSQSLWLSIGMHIINNGISFWLAYLAFCASV